MLNESDSFQQLIGRVKLSVIRLDGILSPFQDGGLVKGVVWRCTFAVTDQCLVWNLQWSGKEDFSKRFVVFQSIMGTGNGLMAVDSTLS